MATKGESGVVTTLDFLERSINSGEALAVAVMMIALPAVGLPVVLTMLLVVWGGVLLLSGVELDPGRIRYAISLLVDLTSFFGIVLGAHFGIALTFSSLTAILKGLILRYGN